MNHTPIDFGRLENKYTDQMFREKLFYFLLGVVVTWALVFFAHIKFI